MKKGLKIFLNLVPVLIMVILIYLVKNDYLLTLFYIMILFVSLKFIKYTKTDIIVLWFGFAGMTVFEYIFVSTGVETFTRKSLFGIMPLWLPFLWSYGFLVIKRSVQILDN